MHQGEECKVVFRDPDEEGLLQYLCEEKQFQRERVVNGIAKLKKARAAKPQARLDQFFTVTEPSVASKNKRKLEEAKNAKKSGNAKLMKGNNGRRAVRR